MSWFFIQLSFSVIFQPSITCKLFHLLLAICSQVIRPFILRRKKDEVEKFLPGKTQVILKCDMSAWQKVYYQQVTELGRVGLAHGEEFF